MTTTKARIIRITKENGVKYADSVGDLNLIHRDTAFARGKGLVDVIAPGMCLASNIQDKRPLRKASIKFKGMVFYEDEIKMQENEENEGVFIFTKGDEEVCQVKAEYGDLERKDAFPPGEIDFTYRKLVKEEDIKKYLKALGIKDLKKLPEMYFASLSAPALLGYGRVKGIDSGIHVSQSFELNQQPETGYLEISITNSRERRGRSMHDMYWLQNERVLAKGKALVLQPETDKSN